MYTLYSLDRCVILQIHTILSLKKTYSCKKKRRIRKMSGQWRKLFGAKCAQGRGNTTYTWEASALQILISGAPRETIHKNHNPLH